MSLYLDASVLVPLFIADPFASRADIGVRTRAQRWIVSDFAAAEFSSSIARHVRTGEMTRQEAMDAFTDFDGWAARRAAWVEATPADTRVAQDFLRRLDLTLRAPDAIHIAMALRLDAEFATFDQRQADCARTLGVKVTAI